MKKLLSSHFLPFCTLCAGALGLLLRIWLQNLEDDKGLLPQSHISITLLFILTAIVLGIAFLSARSTDRDGSFQNRFPRSIWSMLGNLAAAISVGLVSVLEYLTGDDFFNTLCLPLGLLAACALVFAGVRRFAGKTPSFAGYCIVTVYLMLHAVAQCRSWGTEPQLITYCFQLLASIFLMLTAYHRTALTIEKGSYRWFVFTCLAAIFFSCVCAVGEAGLFYLAMAIWCACDFCKTQEV